MYGTKSPQLLYDFVINAFTMWAKVTTTSEVTLTHQ